MSAVRAPACVVSVYWVFRAKENDLVRSFYTQEEALTWVARQPVGQSYDLIRVTTETDGTRTGRTVRTVKGKGEA